MQKYERQNKLKRRGRSIENREEVFNKIKEEISMINLREGEKEIGKTMVMIAIIQYKNEQILLTIMLLLLMVY
jgi:hypothetical protein